MHLLATPNCKRRDEIQFTKAKTQNRIWESPKLPHHYHHDLKAKKTIPKPKQSDIKSYPNHISFEFETSDSLRANSITKLHIPEQNLVTSNPSKIFSYIRFKPKQIDSRLHKSSKPQIEKGPTLFQVKNSNKFSTFFILTEAKLSSNADGKKKTSTFLHQPNSVLGVQ